MISFAVGSASQRRTFLSIQIIFAAFLFAGFHSRAYGQVLYGSIVGTVTDPSGAVVPNSAITVTDIGTQQTRSDTTDGSGRFSITNLPPGTYTVKAITSGFRELDQSNITVTPSTVTRVDLQLQVGEASEKVNVSAQAVELQTDKADTHTEITGQAVQTMPLGGNRNYQTLINLTPGATPGSFHQFQYRRACRKFEHAHQWRHGADEYNEDRRRREHQCLAPAIHGLCCTR